MQMKSIQRDPGSLNFYQNINYSRFFVENEARHHRQSYVDFPPPANFSFSNNPHINHVQSSKNKKTASPVYYNSAMQMNSARFKNNSDSRSAHCNEVPRSSNFYNYHHQLQNHPSPRPSSSAGESSKGKLNSKVNSNNTNDSPNDHYFLHRPFQNNNTFNETSKNNTERINSFIENGEDWNNHQKSLQSPINQPLNLNTVNINSNKKKSNNNTNNNNTCPKDPIEINSTQGVSCNNTDLGNNFNAPSQKNPPKPAKAANNNKNITKNDNCNNSKTNSNLNNKEKTKTNTSKPPPTSSYPNTTSTSPYPTQPFDQLKCPLCGLQLCSNDDLDLHLRTHVNVIPPADFSDIIGSMNRNKTSTNIDASKTKKTLCHCTGCSKSFTRIDKLKLHISKRHPDLLASFYKCQYCTSGFERLATLREHMKLNHREFCKSPKNKIKYNKKQTYTCVECGVEVSSRRALVYHTMAHAGNSPLVCSHCPSKFTRPDKLKRHMLVHTGELPFVCPKCGQGFARTEKLKEHTKLVHHASLLECPQCQQTFNTWLQLKIHLKTHEYTCGDCGQSFTRRRHLQLHQLSHKNNSSIECPDCDGKFSRLDKLRTHMKHIHHKNIIRTPPESSISRKERRRNESFKDDSFDDVKVKLEEKDYMKGNDVARDGYSAGYVDKSEGGDLLVNPCFSKAGSTGVVNDNLMVTESIEVYEKCGMEESKRLEDAKDDDGWMSRLRNLYNNDSNEDQQSYSELVVHGTSYYIIDNDEDEEEEIKKKKKNRKKLILKKKTKKQKDSVEVNKNDEDTVQCNVQRDNTFVHNYNLADNKDTVDEKPENYLDANEEAKKNTEHEKRKAKKRKKQKKVRTNSCEKTFKKENKREINALSMDANCSCKTPSNNEDDETDMENAMLASELNEHLRSFAAKCVKGNDYDDGGGRK